MAFQIANMGLIHLNAVCVFRETLEEGSVLQPPCVTVMSSPLEMMWAPEYSLQENRTKKKPRARASFPFGLSCCINCGQIQWLTNMVAL